VVHAPFADPLFYERAMTTVVEQAKAAIDNPAIRSAVTVLARALPSVGRFPGRKAIRTIRRDLEQPAWL
jgi:hypothetical protein